MLKKRALNNIDAVLFESWEKASRPHPWTKHNFLEGADPNRIFHWVWEDENDPVGFLIFQATADEVYIQNLMVAVNRRNIGVGSQIVDELMAWSRARNQTKLVLETEASNSVAQRFYQKKGFFEVGTRLQAYPDGEAAVIYEKNLKEKK